MLLRNACVAAVLAAAAPMPLLAQGLSEADFEQLHADLTPERAAEAIRKVTPADLHQAVEALNRDYRSQGRPYRIRPHE